MTEDDYKIEVSPRANYIPEQSDPEHDRYVFGYTIRVTNRGESNAKLLGRHWVICDANGKIEEVNGDGVVGQQPLIKPGESFEYSSGAVLETAVGTMKGSYRMTAQDGTEFLAVIPEFVLSVPRVLH